MDQKHNEMKYPYIRDMMQRKIVYLQYISTPEQTADIYAKSTWWRTPSELRGSIDDSSQKQNSEYICVRLGMMKNASLAERECWWLQLRETFSNLQTCEMWIIAVMRVFPRLTNLI